MNADVAVIGLGSVGSMALWQLAQRGVSVMGFEQFGIGHDRSAVGGESRLFRMAYKEGTQYIPILKEAKNLWKELEILSGNRILTLNGGLTIGKTDSELIKSVLKSVEEFDIDHEILAYEEAQKKFPQHKIDSDEMMILDRESGFLRPELGVVSAVKQAEKLGAKVHAYSKVDSIEPDSDGVTIISNNVEYRVKKVLLTTGPWATKFLPYDKEVLRTERLLLSWYQPEKIHNYLSDNFPVFIRRKGNLELYGAPSLDQTMVKISLFKEDDAEIGDIDPNNLKRDVTIDEIIQPDLISELFEGLYPDPVRLSAHMDGYTSDNHGIVGAIDGLPSVIVAVGFSGHGFKMAPALGKIIAEIATEGATSLDIEHFNPNRFNKHASVIS